jgi:hypothetical protein
VSVVSICNLFDCKPIAFEGEAEWWNYSTVRDAHQDINVCFEAQCYISGIFMVSILDGDHLEGVQWHGTSDVSQ